ncbi:hypothetical protein PIB30_061207, partial [Stylosanthes scabra]|nr:hypothetical protein [Stylosanthes scabra]
MGSGIIFYEYEKREKFEDYDTRADAELGTRSTILRLDEQVSAPDLPRRQLIDSRAVVTLRAMISLEFGNCHCQSRVLAKETCVCEVRLGKTVIGRRLES